MGDVAEVKNSRRKTDPRSMNPYVMGNVCIKQFMLGIKKFKNKKAQTDTGKVDLHL